MGQNWLKNNAHPDSPCNCFETEGKYRDSQYIFISPASEDLYNFKRHVTLSKAAIVVKEPSASITFTEEADIATILLEVYQFVVGKILEIVSRVATYIVVTVAGLQVIGNAMPLIEVDNHIHV